MALAGNLGNPSEKKNDGKQQEQETEQKKSPIYRCNVRLFSIIQMILFVAAIIAAMIYVWKASSSTSIDFKPTQEENKCIKVIRVSDYTIENSQIIDTLYIQPYSEPGLGQ